MIKKIGKWYKQVLAKKITHFDQIKSLNLAHIKTITFDMFDTIIFRKIDPPEIIHHLTAERLYHVLIDEGIHNYTVHEILNIRYEVERELRHASYLKEKNDAYSFKNITENYVKRIAGEDFCEKYSEEIIQYELSRELQVSYSNQEVFGVFEFLKQMNKKIIVISDMYFEKEFLEKMMKNCGLFNYIDEILVSNPFMLSKGSDRFDETVHIGDNIISDYFMPTQIGIRAYWYKNSNEIKRKKKIRSKIENSNLNDLLKEFISTPLADKSFYFKLGYRQLGAIFTLYIDEVLRKAAYSKIEGLYFLAREGYLFKKIYGELLKIGKYKTSVVPKDYYLCISRLSSSLSSVRRFGMREIKLGLRKGDQKGLYSILTTFNLNPKQFEKYARVYGFYHIKEPIYDPMNDIRLHNFIEDDHVQQLISKQKKKERILLKKYLQQNNFFGKNKKNILVDIGWNGTIQHNLCRAYIEREDFPAVIGAYFGRMDDYHLRYSTSEKQKFYRGFAFDADSLTNTKFITEFLELFEQAATAPHGSTIGYIYNQESNKVEPIFKSKGEDRFAEQNQVQFIDQIQEGIMQFVKDYVELANMIPINDDTSKAHSLQQLKKFIINPTIEQVGYMATLNHSEDWGASHSLLIVNKNLKLKHFFNKKLLKQELLKGCWIQGTLAYSKIPFVVGLYNRMKKL